MKLYKDYLRLAMVIAPIFFASCVMSSDDCKKLQEEIAKEQKNATKADKKSKEYADARFFEIDAVYYKEKRDEHLKQKQKLQNRYDRDCKCYEK